MCWMLNEISGHIQISQVPGRNEPNTDGEINYQYILQLLEEKKYDGYIGLEYKPKTSTKSSTEWISNWGYSFWKDQCFITCSLGFYY